jgi:hypothetical protein
MADPRVVWWPHGQYQAVDAELDEPKPRGIIAAHPVRGERRQDRHEEAVPSGVAGGLAMGVADGVAGGLADDRRPRARSSVAYPEDGPLPAPNPSSNRPPLTCCRVAAIGASTPASRLATRYGLGHDVLHRGTVRGGLRVGHRRREQATWPSRRSRR